jgi:GAF domain-containing protein
MSLPSRTDVTRATAVTLGRAACVGVVAVAAQVAARRAGSDAARNAIWLVATFAVAGLVIATRGLVDRVADRVAYGPTGDPYSQLSGFLERISETLAVEEVLPRVAQTVTQATHSSRGEVHLWLSDGGEWRESWPEAPAMPTDTVVNVPLRHRGDQVGTLGVATDGVPLAATTRALLERLAGTAGLALDNVRLTYDLRRRIAESRGLALALDRSRRRLLIAAAEQTERFATRVEGQVQSQLRVVERELDRAEDGDIEALDRAAELARAALDALRDLAAGVFPPTLSDSGLRVALDAFAVRYDGRVRVAFAGTDPVRQAPELEAAAYLCAVQLVEDCLQEQGRARLEVESTSEDLTLRARFEPPPSSATLQLIEDRVDATDGVLVRTPSDGADEAGLAVRWPLTEAAG